MNRHVFGALAIILVGVAVMAVFRYMQPKITDAEQFDTSDAGGARRHIRIGMDNWVGYVPLCSKELRRRMHSAGYLLLCEDDNADYQKRMKRLDDRDLELAVATVDSFLLNAAQYNYPGAIVLIIDESKGGDAMVARKSKIPNLEALKNKPNVKIAFTPASPSAHLLRAIGMHFDVPMLADKKGTWRVETNGSAEALEAFQKGKVDVAVLWEPDVSKALHLADTHKLLGTDQTAGLIVDILIAGRDFARDNPDALAVLIANYFRVLKYFRESPDALIDEIKGASGVSTDQAGTLMQGVNWINLTENARNWFGVKNGNQLGREGLIETLEATAQILVDAGEFRESPIPQRDPYRLQYRTYVEQLVKSGLADAASTTTGPIEFKHLDDAAWDELTEIGTMKVRPITFQSGTDALNLAGKEQLDVVAQNLAHYPQFRIVVKGHTGNRGDSKANLELSQARAEAVKRYLAVTHGIEEDRMHAIGYGGTLPLPRNPGESDRAFQYRLPRVELSLMSEVY